MEVVDMPLKPSMTGGDPKPAISNVETPENPLHVKVAEALGATNVRYAHHDPSTGDFWADWPNGNNPYDHHDNCCGMCDAFLIARYDTDWSATGPLIEKYGIQIEPQDPEWKAKDVKAWLAGLWQREDGEWLITVDAFGETPLIAVCNLILALKEAGKL